MCFKPDGNAVYESVEQSHNDSVGLLLGETVVYMPSLVRAPLEAPPQKNETWNVTD